MKIFNEILQYNCDGGKPFSLEGLLDSGADGLFIPRKIADALDLPRLGTINTSGVLKSSDCIRTKVGFRIGRSSARRIDFGVIEATYPLEESDPTPHIHLRRQDTQSSVQRIRLS